jgi:hypothetical protein
LQRDLSDYEERLGYRFQRHDLLTRALTHKSYSHEARQDGVEDNETFEFLGDSVLGFVIGDLLFRRFPTLDEGALSKIKAYLVSATSLAVKARNYGMGEVIYLGVGEEKSGGRKKESLLANVFDPSNGEVRSDSAAGIACWFIDTDYNEESFFVRHAYFLGANDPYGALKTTLKAEIDEVAWATLHSDTSRPFDKPRSGRIAVKVINHLGDEAMKVFRIS